MIAISSIYGLLQVEQINTVTDYVQTNKQNIKGAKLFCKITKL